MASSSGRVTRSSRRRDFQPESSWRMVEGGENDSFDTSILHDDGDGDGDGDDFVLESGSDPSQPSGSQPFSIGGSQDDSIESFLSRAERDDDGHHVLLRSPFRPSVPQSVRQSSADDATPPRQQQQPVPELEFRMPKVDVESPRRSSTRSSTTVRADAPPPSLPGLRRRQGAGAGAGGATGMPAKSRRSREDERGGRSADQSASFGDRVATLLPGALLDALSWALDLVRLAFRYAQKPLALLVSLYVTFGGVIVLQNMVTQSLYTSLSPVCRIPGISWLDLPFCPVLNPAEESGQGQGQPVEFESLMDVQDQLERVLEKSAYAVSLPMEMKRSEGSIRDLRTLVRYSSLKGKEELELEFDGFIDAIGTATRDLQRFNTHVGSAIDSVISISRWTSRYLDGIEGVGSGDGDGDGDGEGDDGDRPPGGLIGAWTSWLFSPFQPPYFSERRLRDMFVEHTGLVSDKIAGLIVEAEGVLRALGRADDHLGYIHDFVTRTQQAVQNRKDEILWTIWTLVGANNRRLDSLNRQLSLLRQVSAQRSDAVRQVSELVVDLQRIQAALADLKDRCAGPRLVRGRVSVPLSVHIETINRGVERLELARRRIRAIENHRISEALARGRGEDRSIEPAAAT